MTDALIGLGGNLGDVPAAIARALDRLGELGLTVVSRSRLYATKPVGPVEQPDFVNGCAHVETDLQPLQLLSITQSLERELGRRPSVRWGPRAIDLDILAYGDVALDGRELCLPHPRLTERAFVLVPLAEIVPDWRIAGRSVREWMERVDKSDVALLGDVETD